MPAVPPSAPNSPPPANDDHNFENALERLETIVQRMEADRLPLEELLSCYEEGTRLVKVCGEFLAVAEQRIELIARDARGEPRVVEFNEANVARLAPTNSAPANQPPASANGPRRSPSRPASPSPSSEPATATPKAPSHEVSLF